MGGKSRYLKRMGTQPWESEVVKYSGSGLLRL